MAWPMLDNLFIYTASNVSIYDILYNMFGVCTLKAIYMNDV